MKKIAFALLITFAVAFSFQTKEAQAQCNQKVVYKCATNNGNAIYLRDFNAKLRKGRKGEPPPVAKFSTVLNKGTHYRFNLCNPRGFEGRAVLKLYDANGYLGGTYDPVKKVDYKSFDFYCRKTATYYVFISYKKGYEPKKGCAVGVLSFVGKHKR